MPLYDCDFDESDLDWGDPELKRLEDELEELLECEDEEYHKEIIFEYESKISALQNKREREQSRDMMDFYGLSWSMFL